MTPAAPAGKHITPPAPTARGRLGGNVNADSLLTHFPLWYVPALPNAAFISDGTVLSTTGDIPVGLATPVPVQLMPSVVS